MPRVIDFPDVQEQMAAQRLVSLYPNSGAFGYPPDVPTRTVGWVTHDDPTIRPAARALTVTVHTQTPPGTLAMLAERARRTLPPGPVWVTPKAHWAYELDFGSGQWMPDLLRTVGIDPEVLFPRHDGSAIEFTTDEGTACAALVAGLLEHLLGSDFQLAFPGRDVVCTVHHHKQLWWTSTDATLIDGLRGMVVDGGLPGR